MSHTERPDLVANKEPFANVSVLINKRFFKDKCQYVIKTIQTGRKLQWEIPQYMFLWSALKINKLPSNTHELHVHTHTSCTQVTKHYQGTNVFKQQKGTWVMAVRYMLVY